MKDELERTRQQRNSLLAELKRNPAKQNLAKKQPFFCLANMKYTKVKS